MFLSSKDEYVHLFQSLGFSRSSPPTRLHIFKVSLFFNYRYLSLYLFCFSGLEKQNTHTHRILQTSVHETIHIHRNVFRKRTRGDKEVLFFLTSVEESEGKHECLCEFSFLEERGDISQKANIEQRRGGFEGL